jgi:hypothetical protein
MTGSGKRKIKLDFTTQQKSRCTHDILRRSSYTFCVSHPKREEEKITHGVLIVRATTDCAQATKTAAPKAVNFMINKSVFPRKW